MGRSQYVAVNMRSSDGYVYYTKLNEEGKATPDEYAAWMTRAAKRGV
jgi:hypothetical protein